MWLVRVFVQEGVAFRRLENPPVGGQAVGGWATFRVVRTSPEQDKMAFRSFKLPLSLRASLPARLAVPS
ncbi:hypothetical protein ES708_22558 [subsurface metagenome]